MSQSRRHSLVFRSASLEILEERALLSALAAVDHSHLAPTAVRELRPLIMTPVSSTRTTALGHAHTFLVRIKTGDSPGPLVSPPPGALTPAQTRHIYSFDQISNLGSGQTIAIVDAYSDPDIFKDADTFDKQFMTTLTGSTTYYSAYGASHSWLT